MNDGWGERACVEVARRITFFIRRAPRVYLEVITGRWKRVARQRLLEYRPTGVHLGEPGFNALFSSLSIFSRRAYMHTRLGVTSKKKCACSQFTLKNCFDRCGLPFSFSLYTLSPIAKILLIFYHSLNCSLSLSLNISISVFLLIFFNFLLLSFSISPFSLLLFSSYLSFSPLPPFSLSLYRYPFLKHNKHRDLVR